VDLWPYVNGKAITLGLNLGELEVSQMLDLIHYFFEEDSRFSTAEEAEAVSQMRSVIYGMLYGTTYKYKVGKSSNSNVGEGFNTGETKPYIPPTEFDADSYLPFGNTLDAPLG
jgi:hypothetical protein